MCKPMCSFETFFRLGKMLRIRLGHFEINHLKYNWKVCIKLDVPAQKRPGDSVLFSNFLPLCHHDSSTLFALTEQGGWLCSCDSHDSLTILGFSFYFSMLDVKFVWLLVYVDGLRRPLLPSSVFKQLLEICHLMGICYS